MRYRMFSRILGLYPLAAGRLFLTGCDNQSVSRHGQMSHEGQTLPLVSCGEQCQREVWILVHKTLRLMGNLCKINVLVHAGQETWTRILREGSSCLGTVTMVLRPWQVIQRS